MPLTLTYLTGLVMAGLFGLVVGSFLNVCIYRLPQGGSLTHPPSHCPSCQTRLRPLDLVPLFSFLALRGKCRYCGVRISWRYFTIELITGILFAAIWWSLAAQYGTVLWSPAGLLMLAMLCVWASAMLVTFMIDLDTTYVIEPVTWVAMGAGIVFELAAKWLTVTPVEFKLGGMTIPYLPTAVPGMIVGFLVFIAMDLFGRLIFRKPGMGLGDSYIGAAIGAVLGPGLALLSFGMAIVLGAVIGVALIISGALAPAPAPGSADSVSEGALQEDADDLPEGRYMPFGPFLTACAVAVALAPEWFSHGIVRLFHWWLNTMS